MEVFYDLHIHSVLSPCGSEDMTPNNIVNMALIKGLDVITVSDHNCADNTPAVERLAADAGLIFVPGIEMTTAEEVHVLAFFPSAKEAKDFGAFIYASLPEIPNNADFFGRQLIMNEKDEIIGSKEKLLLSALPFDFTRCCELAGEYGGIAVPAHVNKEANSVLGNLGFFPESCSFGTIEVRPELSQASVPDTFRQVHSSDAHDLEFIAEPEWTLNVAGRNSLSILRALA